MHLVGRVHGQAEVQSPASSFPASLFRRAIADGKPMPSRPRSLILLVLVASLVVLLAYRLARLYRPESATSAKGWLEEGPRRTESGELRQLALISGLTLFLDC